MRLIFLNRFYWPEEPATAQLLTDLAEAFAREGHDVTVVTSHPGHAGLPHRQVHHGVTIRRVRSTRLGGLGKVLDFATFQLAALGRLLLLARRDDRVVVLTDPPLLGIGGWLTARLCGARVHHWVQDIYPEIAVALTGHTWLALTAPLRNLAWRRADGCVTLGTDMAATVAAAGVDPRRIAIVPNWAPAGLEPQPASAADELRRAWGLEGKFVVAYSGNLGRVHDLWPVLDAAAELRGDPGIAFVFIGNGPQRAALEAGASQRGLTNVQFHPPQRRSRLNAALALGDVHLVTLLPGCERLVFPSKLYGVAAVGRPVVVIAPRDCELARLVESAGLGRAFDRADPVALAAGLRALAADRAVVDRMGRAAERFGRDATGPTRALAAWQAHLEDPA